MRDLRRGADITSPMDGRWRSLPRLRDTLSSDAPLHSDVDVNLANKDNESALMRAVLAGHAEVTTALLSAPGIEVNAKTSAGKSALIIAAGCGQAAIASALLVADDIEVNATDADGKSALIRACEAGHADIALSLLVTDGVDIDLADAAGKTAKMHALAQGHERIVGLIEEMQKRTRRSGRDAAHFLSEAPGRGCFARVGDRGSLCFGRLACRLCCISADGSSVKRAPPSHAEHGDGRWERTLY